MNQTAPPDNARQSLEAAQLEKLNLEILTLKKRSPWLDSVLQLQPAVTVVLAVGAFLFGIFQYSKSEQKARMADQVSQKIKIQDQIRSDLDEIVRFPTDQKQTSSRVTFLLADLDRLMNTSLGDAAAVPPEERHRASDILAQLIDADTDLNERRNVSLTVTILRGWGDYSRYLEANPGLLLNVFANYFDALEGLRKKSPKYFSRLKYNPTKTEFHEPVKVPAPDQTDLRHFEELVQGYSEYLKLVKDPNMRQFVLKNFQMATCNKELTDQEFGMSFDPKQDPSAFASCP